VGAEDLSRRREGAKEDKKRDLVGEKKREEKTFSRQERQARQGRQGGTGESTARMGQASPKISGLGQIFV
jgi:hypothetical protein